MGRGGELSKASPFSEINQEKEGITMNARKVMTLASMVAMLFAPVAFSSAGVLGEKLDSGLGDLPASYTAAEFQTQVIGQKLDSGLGDLPSTYAAAEFQRHVLGENLDSGLGDLPSSYAAAEFQPKAALSGYRVLGESLDSGLGDLPPSYTASEFQKRAVASL